MANYMCTVRTNYFHVKDAEKFKEIMEQVQGYEDEVKLWEETDQDGNPVFGFGCESGIAGIPCAPDDNGETEIDDDSYDRFIEMLQECVADDDAVIIMEAGHEKLRYVVGSAEIITSRSTKYLDISRLAVKTAGKMLGCEFATKMDY